MLMGERIDLRQRPRASSSPNHHAGVDEPVAPSPADPTDGPLPAETSGDPFAGMAFEATSTEQEVTDTLATMIEDAGVLEELLPDDVGDLHYPGIAHFMHQVRSGLRSVRALREVAKASRGTTGTRGSIGAPLTMFGCGGPACFRGEGR